MYCGEGKARPRLCVHHDRESPQKETRPTSNQGEREETKDIQLDKVSRNKEAMSLWRDPVILRDWGRPVGGVLVPTQVLLGLRDLDLGRDRIREFNELGQHAGIEMPSNVTMQSPNTRIVGHKLNDSPSTT